MRKVSLKKPITVIFFAIAFCLITLACSNSPVYATDSKSFDEICEEYNLRTVTEVPDGVQPVEVKSEEELIQLLESIKNARIEITSESSVVDVTPSGTFGISPLGSQSVLVDQVSWYIGSIKLYARITDNGYMVTSATAYTTLSGFTLGFDWDERACGASIVSGGRDVYAWAAGTLDYYLLVNGVIRLYSEEVNLEGLVMIFH